MTVWPFREPPQRATYTATAAVATDLEPPAGPACWAAPGTSETARIHFCNRPAGHTGPHACGVPACSRLWWPKKEAA